MKHMKKSLKDILFLPFTYLSAVWLRKVRENISAMKRSKRALMKVGVFPILDRYWEPLFNPKHLRHPLDQDRNLPGIDFNIKEQLDLLGRFHFNDELAKFPLEKTDRTEFYYHNGAFEPGDAEYLYNMIRLFKPKNLVEIGSGNSTLMAINAINANKAEDPNYSCEHICIEPYECPWLEQLPVKVIRGVVESVDKSIFLKLERNDILFIDSSHVIRPQGDVLVEYLEILPVLKPAVIVHIHDIFTPKDYPDQLLFEEVRFWNEQYLLEALLTFNTKYKVIASLNHLKHKYFKEISAKCPALKDEPHREPGSFYIIKQP